MTRLFRRPEADFANWLALAVFAVAFLLALAFVLLPGLTDSVIRGAS